MLPIGSTKLHKLSDFKTRLSEFGREFELCAILDSNSESIPTNSGLSGKYDLIAGFTKDLNKAEIIKDLSSLDRLNSKSNDWYLGYLSYDLKNEIENLKSENPDKLQWPPLLFFKPEILFLVSNKELTVYSSIRGVKFEDLMASILSITVDEAKIELPIMYPRLSKEDYLEKIAGLKNHIQRGDIYEINFCMEFYNNSHIDPYGTFHHINKNSPAPFSAFFRYNHNFLLSVSPERYLRKEDENIISQPIKGTAPRGNSPAEDEKNKSLLENSLKERTENIMITDLVRNDLSRIARKKSVSVEELCGIYSYPYVYQMISTVKAKIDNLSMLDIILATFPMGSMTGAPKIRAMQLIEEYETVKRGLYSGAVGYIGPGMDFDLNVVIRSLQYNASNQYLSYISGSAITDLAEAESEYEECLLKAYAINPQLKQSLHA